MYDVKLLAQIEEDDARDHVLELVRQQCGGKEPVHGVVVQLLPQPELLRLAASERPVLLLALQRLEPVGVTGALVCGEEKETRVGPVPRVVVDRIPQLPRREKVAPPFGALAPAAELLETASFALFGFLAFEAFSRARCAAPFRASRRTSAAVFAEPDFSQPVGSSSSTWA